jgi:hypothetical protein
LVEASRNADGQTSYFAKRLISLSQEALRLLIIDTSRRFLGLPPTEQTSYQLFEAVHEGPQAITEQLATTLAGLAMEAGGWHLFDDADPDDEATFIPQDEWMLLFQQWKLRRGQSEESNEHKG